MNLRLLLTRGGLGNRLRFIETTLARVDPSHRVVVIWPVNAECFTDFHSHFRIADRPRVRFLHVGRASGAIASAVNLVLSKLLPRYVSREKRDFNPRLFYDSSVHSLDKELRRFEYVRYSQTESKDDPGVAGGTAAGSYSAFYLRGRDNKTAIDTTDYRRLLTELDRRVSAGERCVGVTDEPGWKAVLKSFGATVPERRELRRDTRLGMSIAVADLKLLSDAEAIYSSNYSSFSELAYCLSRSAELVICRSTETA